MSHFNYLFHDESGIPGDEIFVSGLLKVRDCEQAHLAISRVREECNFPYEMHFTVTSEHREKTYIRLLEEMAKQKSNLQFCSIVVKKENVDLKYFSQERYLAYNYFTKLLLRYRCRNLREARMITDAKTRARNDNFESYIKWEINQLSRDEHDFIKSVTAKSSHTDDLLQLVDILVGSVACLQKRSKNMRKMRVAKKARELVLISNCWIFTPKR